MIDQIIVGMAQALDDKFGYPVHVNKIKQGLEEPCFLIKGMRGSQSRKMGIRFEQLKSFDVHYFPSTDDITEECTAIEQRLYDTLEYVQTEAGLFRAKEMSGEVQNDVLHFFIDFDFFLLKQPAKVDPMETIAIDIDKKEGG